LEWCYFLSKEFKTTQFRKVGVYTAFSIAYPMVHCMHESRQHLNEQKKQEAIEKREN